MKEERISARQMWMNLIIIAGIPSFRLLEPLVVQTAGNGAPVSFLLSSLLCLPLLFFYSYVAKRQRGKSFVAVNQRLFGKRCGWVIAFFYTLWLLFLSAFYLGIYGERINGTLFYDTDTVVFLLLLLFAVSFAVKKGAGTLARTGSVMANIILLMLAFFSLILVRDVRLTNYLPLGGSDLLPALRGAVPGAAVAVFFPLFFVFGEELGTRRAYLPYALKSLAAITAITVTVCALPLGVFGKETLGKLTTPFFAVTRNVVVLDSLERLEAFVAAMLIMSDFVIVAMLSLSSARLTRDLFGAKNESNFIDIMIFGFFMGSMLTSVGEFRMEEFMSRRIIPVNLAFGVLIPLLWFVAARIRKLPQTT